MLQPRKVTLTKEKIHSIDPREIIYIEIAQPGAMGNAGGVMLYIIENEALICYETNVFDDEPTYDAVNELLMKHFDSSFDSDSEIQDFIFDEYPGGMGNSVFINKNFNLEIGDRYFIYKQSNKEYCILSSLFIVYKNVVYSLENFE